ncbi:MAG: hypothetical protein ABI999_00440 [Acidobacteriota bacterium]
MIGVLQIVQIILLTLFVAVSTLAQADTFDVGGRTIAIPPPEGFVDGLKFERYAAVIAAAESASLYTLVSHVEIAIAKRIEKGGSKPLDLYTKVSIAKDSKQIDQTPEIFSATVATLEKNFDTYIDPDGSTIRSIVKEVDRGLTNEYGKQANVSISQPRRLGFFEKNEQVFSAIMINQVKAFDRQKTMLVSISLIRVGRRLLYAYVYKAYRSESDVQLVTETTKKWTQAIVAANK